MGHPEPCPHCRRVCLLRSTVDYRACDWCHLKHNAITVVGVVACIVPLLAGVMLAGDGMHGALTAVGGIAMAGGIAHLFGFIGKRRP